MPEKEDICDFLIISLKKKGNAVLLFENSTMLEKMLIGMMSLMFLNHSKETVAIELSIAKII